jgi:8-oxo-dGTP pyrophosphatase MutT (NUDIX family)
MELRPIVTCFLSRGGRVLLLRRSGQVRTYPGKWAAVSGAMETPDPRREALRELREETLLGPPDVEVVAEGPPLLVQDARLGIAWEVHPVLAELAEGAEPTLDWEHTEAHWVPPEDLARYDTVPQLAEALAEVWRGPG